jgi:triosephosphate isomerase
MRKKIVAGNWKMNLVSSEANSLFDSISENLSDDLIPTIMVFPPSLFVSQLKDKGNTKIEIGVQNFYPKDKGAYTGEISVAQVKDLGLTQVLIGHSERRAYFNETSLFLKEKVDAAISYNLGVVFCCGEPLEIREANSELEYVKLQLEESLFHLSDSDILKCIIAYEPVWAIGTGKTASIEQAEDMHREIRKWLAERYTNEIAESISILYGGSCNAANAKELFSCPNVDGGLIGGAALDSSAFLQIANSF